MLKKSIIILLCAVALSASIWCWISITKTPDKRFYGICINNEQEYITVYPLYGTAEHEQTEYLHYLNIITDSKTRFYNTKAQKTQRADFDKGYVAEIIYSSDETINDDGKNYTLKCKELRLTDRRIMTEAPDLTVYSGSIAYSFKGHDVFWSYSIGGGKFNMGMSDFDEPVLRKLVTVIDDSKTIKLKFDIEPKRFGVNAWPGELIGQKFDPELVESKKLTKEAEGYELKMTENPDGWVIQVWAYWEQGKHGEPDSYNGSGEYAFLLIK